MTETTRAGAAVGLAGEVAVAVAVAVAAVAVAVAAERAGTAQAEQELGWAQTMDRPLRHHRRRLHPHSPEAAHHLRPQATGENADVRFCSWPCRSGRWASCNRTHTATIPLSTTGFVLDVEQITLDKSDTDAHTTGPLANSGFACSTPACKRRACK